MDSGVDVMYGWAEGRLGALSDRLGRRRVIIVGWLLYAAIYLGFGLASQTWQIIGLYVLYGLYYAATDGVVGALIGGLVPDAQRVSADGVYSPAVGAVGLPASARRR